MGSLGRFFWFGVFWCTGRDIRRAVWDFCGTWLCGACAEIMLVGGRWRCECVSGVSGNGREDMVYHRCPLGLVKIAWMVRQGQGIWKDFGQPPPDISFPSCIWPFFLPTCPSAFLILPRPSDAFENQARREPEPRTSRGQLNERIPSWADPLEAARQSG